MATNGQAQVNGAPPGIMLPQAVPPTPLSLQDNKIENWTLWKQVWQNFLIVARLDAQPAEYKVALFLSYVGVDALRMYNSMKFDEGENGTVEGIIKKFDEVLIGEINETYERYVFNSRSQKEGENIDAYVTTLRNLTKNCNFCECLSDTLLRDRIVIGIRDNSVRKKLLETKNLTAQKCVDICRAAEVTEARMRTMTSATEQVHRVGKAASGSSGRHRKPPAKTRGQPKKSSQTSSADKITCRFCCYEHVRDRDKCPAFGKTCRKCNKPNHFEASSECKAKKKSVRHIAEVSDEEYEIIDTVQVRGEINAVAQETSRELYAQMLVGEAEEPVNFQLDSGASVNLISSQHAPADLEKTNKVLVMWNQAKVKPVGQCRLLVKNPQNNKKYAVRFIVVKEQLTPLLGANAVQKMNLLTVHSENFRSVHQVHDESSYPEFVSEFRKDVFSDTLVGEFEGQGRLKVDPEAETHVARGWKVPFAVKPSLKAELDRLQNLGVIIPVDQPTEWVSNMVVGEKKNGDLRICLDPQPLNKALKREHFQLPVLDDVLPELSRARVFSTADLKHGYWHVVLDEDSSKLTTFATPFGRYRYLRLPFGLSVSSEIFQKKLLANIGDLQGVFCINDDIIIQGIGDTYEETVVDHDANLL